MFKKGLVLEGGAMRGMFTCGILDVFMENGIEFDGAVGISAGACFGCNIKSRQPGRALRYNLRFAHDKRYCSVHSLITTGDLYNVDFCYKQIPQVLDPFDFAALKANPMEFYMGCTDIHTGEAVFAQLVDGSERDLKWMQASASMPLVSRPVQIDGGEYLDGGMSDSIPLKFLESKGFNRNIVILTQPRDYVKGPNKLIWLMKILLRKYPNLIKVMQNRHLMYNEETRYVFEQEKAGNTLVICPEKALGISRTEHDTSELQRVYDMGRRLATERLDEIRTFLAG
ncbi:MAG: patatin family protein [Fibrobacter sp.]|uniref:patatin-like phospholipase family protein n=1 Tax=Fibrobacter sp. UWP2 TaxID=1896216 RepID=UPI000933D528|nr:patatin family protein [Fibrobacter sp. UWP2]MBO7383897.1 patatin family protein [Fibrobacter sp.]